jgi:hypothetical protein
MNHLYGIGRSEARDLAATVLFVAIYARPFVAALLRANCGEGVSYC